MFLTGNLWSVLLQQLVLLLCFTFHMWCWSFWGGMYLNVIMSQVTAFFSQEISVIFHVHSDVWTECSINQFNEQLHGVTRPVFTM